MSGFSRTLIMANHDLDELIDEAARGIVQREPSQALTPTVMERVRHDAPPRPQRPLRRSARPWRD